MSYLLILERQGYSAVHSFTDEMERDQFAMHELAHYVCGDELQELHEKLLSNKPVTTHGYCFRIA